MTDAVRDSLERRLQQLRDAGAERRRRTDELLGRFDTGPDLAPGFTDKHLHDANGDPIG